MEDRPVFRATERRRAFTLIEVLVVIAIVALLVALALPAIGKSKFLARKALCYSNLHQSIIAVATYGSDFQDRAAGFTWEKNKTYADWVGPAATVTLASANQAVDILRRRADRTDITQINGWIPNVLYTHLVLNDFLQQRLPEPTMACPEDARRVQWQRSVIPNWQGFHALPAPSERPGTSGVDNVDKRWPYSTSYEFVSSFWAPDQATRRGTIIDEVPTQHGLSNHYTYFVPGANQNTKYGNRRLSDVYFPNKKVIQVDTFSRHGLKRGQPQMYYAYPAAQTQAAFVDGSVRDLKTSNTNKGFRPNQPTAAGATQFRYAPREWEPPKPNGLYTGVGDPVEGFYRWTRGGLRGVDMLGNEIPGRPF